MIISQEKKININSVLALDIHSLLPSFHQKKKKKTMAEPTPLIPDFALGIKL